MKDKASFLEELSAKRKANRKDVDGLIKKEYYPSDNDLAWKMYAAFPGHFTHEERTKLLKFLTMHMTQITCSALRRGKSSSEIADIIIDNLTTTFGIYLSKKVSIKFIQTVQKLSRWND